MMQAYLCFSAGLLLSASAPVLAQRARDLRVPFAGTPGLLNAITDIAGIKVGHTTLIESDSVRTGVTVIWPRGKQSDDPVFGGWFSLNGNGEMTGTTWLEESGFVDGPIFITKTHSVGTVRDSYIRWQADHNRKPGTNSSPADTGVCLSLPRHTTAPSTKSTANKSGRPTSSMPSTARAPARCLKVMLVVAPE
jgi:Peptidase family S58